MADRPTLRPEQSSQAGAAHFLYDTRFGRVILWLMIRPWVSRAAGWFLDRRMSGCLVSRFVKKNSIYLTDYEGAPYRTFNAFFCRPIRAGLRPFVTEETVLPSPCDAKCTVWPIGEDHRFFIKGVEYTAESLFQSKELAKQYAGGWLCLLRLAVDDYHRYAFPVDGTVSTPVHISGVFHTVNPLAAAARPIYRENTREYVTLSTELFGDLLQMEVGAMLVGRIVNEPLVGPVFRGQEKGHFEFGGSTILLCTPPGRFQPEAELIHNTTAGLETVVKMGESLGYAQTSGTV